MLRGLIFVLPLIIAGFLLYLFFFYYPPPSDIDIEVSGAGIFLATIKEKKAVYRGLELIRDYSTDDYEFVQTYVDTIEVAGPLGWDFFSGRVRGYYQKGPDGFNKKIRIVRIFDCPAHCSNEGFNGGDLLLAEFMIHEACHSMQFDFARKTGPRLWKDFREEVFVYDYDLNLGF